MPFRTPAVSVDAGTVVVVVGATVVVVVGAAVVVVVGAPVVVGATVVVVVGVAVVVGAVVAAGATVVAGAAVVDGAPVVEGTAVVGVATEVVATGAVVSALLLHAEVTSSKTTRTAYFLTASVCHPSPEGAGATSEPPGVDTRRRAIWRYEPCRIHPTRSVRWLRLPLLSSHRGVLADRAGPREGYFLDCRGPT